MKKMLFASLVSLLILACNNEKKADVASSKDADMTTLYEKNLAVIKSGIAAFEKKDIEVWAALVADSVNWSSPA